MRCILLVLLVIVCGCTVNIRCDCLEHEPGQEHIAFKEYGHGHWDWDSFVTPMHSTTDNSIILGDETILEYDNRVFGE